MKLHYKLLSLFSLIILSSCEYENSGFYEPIVNKDVTPPEIQVVQLDLQQDTIPLLFDKSVNFRFQSSNQDIVSVTFYIDNTAKTVITSSSGSFDLSWNNLSEGIHKLKIEIFTRSGTNSIADILGVEGFLFSTKEWIINVEKNPLTGLKTEVINGFLKLKWQTYRKTDFQKYIICRYITNSVKEIGRSTKPEFFDKTYVGEGGYYYIKVKTNSGEINWNDGRVDREFTTLKFKATLTNEYFLTWSKNKFYNALDTVKIYCYNDYGYKIILKETVDLNDTTYIINDRLFSESRNYYLTIVPKFKGSYFLNQSNDFYFFKFCDIGIPSPIIKSYLPVNNDELIFEKSDSLVRYSVSQNKILERIGYSSNLYYTNFEDIKISSGGKFITAYLDFWSNVYFASIENLNNYSKKNLQNYLSTTAIHSIPVSDSGIGILMNNSQVYIYNLLKDSLIFSYSLNTYGDCNISSNGEYFYINNGGYKLFQIKDKTVTQIFSLSNSKSYLEFIPNETKFVYWNGVTFYVKNCSDLTIVNQFPLNTDKILNIDFYKGEILTHTQCCLRIYSIIDGALLYNIPINSDNHYTSNNYFLHNHTIFCGKGVKYIINTLNR